jgi:hypothetical protein
MTSRSNRTRADSAGLPNSHRSRPGWRDLYFIRGRPLCSQTGCPRNESLFGIGLAVLILGILFFVPIPRSERHRLRGGEVDVGLTPERPDHPRCALSVVIVRGGRA